MTAGLPIPSGLGVSQDLPGRVAGRGQGERRMGSFVLPAVTQPDLMDGELPHASWVCDLHAAHLSRRSEIDD